MTKRFRIRLVGQVVGVSIYADKFVVNHDSVGFMGTDNMFIAIFQVEHIEKILDGPTADNVLWTNSGVARPLVS